MKEITTEGWVFITYGTAISVWLLFKLWDWIPRLFLRKCKTCGGSGQYQVTSGDVSGCPDCHNGWISIF